ncbi:MAG TPA: chromosomal replication initiator protein DnaA [Solirubrobacteraceae bacterium]|jgi:chromosomal replication initiator protein|nr:chromosomal replication initiator protein DnaA [Solirubrobacteraceae bacterium]
MEPHDAWNRIRVELRATVGERTYGLWLEPLRCDGLEDGALRLSGPPEVSAWAADRLADVIQRAVTDVLGEGVSVRILGGEPATRRPPTKAGDDDAGTEALNPKYNFEQFVIGASNRLAHAASLSVAELPAQAYNPLFIYGPPGLGKTHLLHSIGNYVRSFGAGLTVRYTTVEAFTNEFVSALGGSPSGKHDFKRRFRGVDVLLIDDIQFLERKAATEQELFHTFNALYDAGSQLVITSDRTPSDLAQLEDRLRERFQAGLVTDIGRPDYATRLAILRKRAVHDGIAIDERALAEIATSVASNVRALEGALIRVVAYASLTGSQPTPALAAEVIERLGLRSRRAATPTIERIQEAICAYFSVSREELLSRSRAHRLAWPRHVAIYLARELTDHSLPVIGREFGGRDHSTVLNACKRAAAHLAADPGAYSAVERLTADLRAPTS